MERDNNGQPDRRLGRGHHNDEKCKNLAVQISKKSRKRDERQVHGIEHQFDAHENGDNTPAENKSCRAKDKENNAERQVVCKWDHIYPQNRERPVGREDRGAALPVASPGREAASSF